MPTLLAVSGGVDSMVLAELFRRAGSPFALAHCNFGLRGDESDADERFVRQWAENAGVPCHVHLFDTQAEADKRRISIQMAARDLRYAWFKELLDGFGYPYLALAHHADDSIETVLLNLVRGTGLPGMIGIAPVRNRLIRPLLYSSKHEILNFARHQNIPWREDSSNATDHYRRNVLRHRVVPVLQELNPSLEATFLQTSERLRAASSVLDVYLATWRSQAVRQEGDTHFVSIDMLRRTREPVYLLHTVLEPFGYSYAQVQNIVATLDATSGKQFHSHSHSVVKDRTELIISPQISTPDVRYLQIAKGTSRIHVSEKGVLLLTHHTYFPTFVPTPDKHIAYFDEALLCFPLVVRPWQIGDWFCPFGMSGKRKKVSDLLVEHKIPVSHKPNCLVLLNGDQQILWVIGLRADDRFRLGPHSIKFLQVEYLINA
ncbi:tRNA lysidine(34) synthetase TilS [Salmonirosea aquatica]